MTTRTQQTRFVLSASDKTKAVFSRVQQSMSGIRESVNSVQAKIGGLVGAAGLGLVVSRTIDATRQTLAYSNALNESVEVMTGWQIAGARVGLGADKIADIMKDTTEKIGDAFRNQGGEAVEVVESLGLNLEALARQSPSQQLLSIAEAMEQVGTRGEKVQILEALASDATLLLPLLDDNAVHLRAITDEADALQATLSDVDAAQIGMAAEAAGRMRTVMIGIGNQITVAVAPFLKVVADRFVEAAKASGGFERVVTRVMENVSVAAQFSADALRGLEFVWVGIQFAFSRAAEFIFSGLVDLDRTIVETVNKLPLVSLEVSEMLQSLSASQRATTERLRGELEAIVNAPPPSERVAMFFAEIRAEAATAAEAVARARLEMGNPLPGGGAPEGQAAVDDKTRERLARQIEQLEVSLMDEEQRLFNSFANRQLMVEDAFEARQISEQRHQELLLQVAADFEAKRTQLALKGMTERDRFEALSTSNKIKSQLGALTAMTQGTANSNKKIFDLNQKLSEANAIVSLPAAVIKTYENNGGWPWGVVPAAIMAATGFAQIKAIRSASFGGSGGAPSLAATGGTPSNPVPQQPLENLNDSGRERQGSQITVIFQGNVYGNDDFERLLIETYERAQLNDRIRLIDAS